MTSADAIRAKKPNGVSTDPKSLAHNTRRVGLSEILRLNTEELSRKHSGVAYTQGFLYSVQVFYTVIDTGRRSPGVSTPHKLGSPLEGVNV